MKQNLRLMGGVCPDESSEISYRPSVKSTSRTYKIGEKSKGIATCVLTCARRSSDKLRMTCGAKPVRTAGVIQKSSEKTTCKSPITGKWALRRFKGLFWRIFIARIFGVYTYEFLHCGRNDDVRRFLPALSAGRRSVRVRKVLPVEIRGILKDVRRNAGQIWQNALTERPNASAGRRNAKKIWRNAKKFARNASDLSFALRSLFCVCTRILGRTTARRDERRCLSDARSRSLVTSDELLVMNPLMRCSQRYLASYRFLRSAQACSIPPVEMTGSLKDVGPNAEKVLQSAEKAEQNAEKAGWYTFAPRQNASDLSFALRSLFCVCTRILGRTTARRDEQPSSNERLKTSYRCLHKVGMTSGLGEAALRALKPYSLRLIPKIFLITLKILFCVCLAHARQSSSPEAAYGVALSTDSIRPLKIGDSIPEALWNLPLQMVKAGQEGSTTITLNDYRGKLIILDFWATWCGGCVAGLPKLFAFEREYDLKLVPITNDSEARVDAFLKKSTSKFVRVIKDDFHSIVKDAQRVKKYFPSFTIPHTVVVSPQGMVLAITTAELLSEGAIKSYVAGNYEVYVPLKRDRFSEPLLVPDESLPQLNRAPYYSTLVGSLDGLIGYFTSKRDSSINAYQLVAVSRTIEQLYVTALAGQIGFGIVPNRKILEVSNPANLMHHGDDDGTRTAFKTDWKRNNQYTYQAILPLNTSDSAARTKMRSDLDMYLGLHGRIEKREMRTLTLHCYDKEKIRSKGKEAFYFVRNGQLNKRFADQVEKMPPSALGAKTYLRNMGFDKMVYFLNRNFEDVPPIFDGTDIDFLVDIDLPDVFTLKNLEEWFEKQGLYFEEEVKAIPMLVISEPELENSNELVFTKYGYIPKSLN